ncbi:MAG TPA: hypothetical protein VGF70_05440 [Solirubrobacteraceae bacterium]
MSAASAEATWPGPILSALARTVELERLREFGPLAGLLALTQPRVVR